MQAFWVRKLQFGLDKPNLDVAEIKKCGILFILSSGRKLVSLAVLVKASLNPFPSRNVLIFPPTPAAISSRRSVVVGRSNCIGFENSVCCEHPSPSSVLAGRNDVRK